MRHVPHPSECGWEEHPLPLVEGEGEGIMTSQQLPGPLEGVLLLETGTELGAWCGKLLADMGARVIKVEPPSGERSRAYEPFHQDRPGVNNSLFFWHYNTSKLSITVDLETARGQALFRHLAERADGIIDSNDPGHLDKLSLGYSALSRVTPRLVMAGITPFGQDGPYRKYATTDLTAIAFGGPAWSCGYDDHSIPPVRGGGNQAYHTVCHFAVMGVLIALLHREVSGRGQYIDANMHA
ncbi:MAG: CoA transferase, partial [SAR202 cluster bacterium]|nr:CoA transferase [SAR202 cluster bacterium]